LVGFADATRRSLPASLALRAPDVAAASTRPGRRLTGRFVTCQLQIGDRRSGRHRERRSAQRSDDLAAEVDEVGTEITGTVSALTSVVDELQEIRGARRHILGAALRR
jgi:hypothetical protein